MKTVLDGRYSVALEFNGARPRRVWVARFCGSYIGWSEVKGDARALARAHRRDFVGRMLSV